MKIWIKLLALMALTLLTSCGADKLNTKPGSSVSNLNSSSQVCQCTSENSPVCGIVNNAKKDFDNVCVANCFSATSITAGHCDCSQNPIMVCGSDGRDYSECDARNLGIKIVKFVPCSATPM